MSLSARCVPPTFALPRLLLFVLGDRTNHFTVFHRTHHVTVFHRTHHFTVFHCLLLLSHRVWALQEKNGKITGLHNWIQYYQEEQKGNIDYLGWVGKQDSDYSDDVNLVTVKFAWEDDDQDSEAEVKPCSTILCGSTVEFEIAILTLGFLGGNQNGDNNVQLGSEAVNIKCYAQRVRHGGAKIATAFLEIA
jgi:hypothetical protein